MSDTCLEEEEVAGGTGARGANEAREPARCSVVPQVERCQGGRLTHLDGTGRQM